jgi:ferrochelatase
MKIAIIFLNTGGPNKASDVKPFLYNFFSDKNIITLNRPLRDLVKFLIVNLKWKNSVKNYSLMQYDGGSPLLQNTKNQVNAVQNLLEKMNDGNEYKCFVGMRYWHPFISESMTKIIDYKPDKIIVFPLYPHYSFSTTKSAFEEVQKFVKNIKTHYISCFFANEGFINAHLDIIKKHAKKEICEGNTLIFIAHGIPLSYVKNGDPYYNQIQNSMMEIVYKLKKELKTEINYDLCFQSRVGKLEWLKPYAEDVLPNYKGKKVVLLPISFVSEHIETLVELDVEYSHIAKEFGVLEYKRLPTLSENELFIDFIAKEIIKYV